MDNDLAGMAVLAVLALGFALALAGEGWRALRAAFIRWREARQR